MDVTKVEISNKYLKNNSNNFLTSIIKSLLSVSVTSHFFQLKQLLRCFEQNVLNVDALDNEEEDEAMVLNE
jgi:hypothetical protein